LVLGAAGATASASEDGAGPGERPRREAEATALERRAAAAAEKEDFAGALTSLREALAIRTTACGANHWRTADARRRLADLQRTAGMSREARRQLREADRLTRSVLALYGQGKLAEAVSTGRRALGMWERLLGTTHPRYADSLNNLAAVYAAAGKYGQAEPLYQQALEVRKKVLGTEHPAYAQSLNNLGVAYKDLGDYAKAEPLLREALRIRGQALGEDQPEYATSLNNLAELYQDTAKYARAEPLYRRAVEIRKRVLGPTDPAYASALTNLARLYESMGDFARAERLACQGVEVFKQALGTRHQLYAFALQNLAALYAETGERARAESLYREALKVEKDVLGERHPACATTLNNLAVLCRSAGEYARAEAFYRQANAIFKDVFGEMHPDFATGLANVATLYDEVGDFAKAETLHTRAAEIFKKVLGDKHPDYAASLDQLALHYTSTGAYDRAEPLLLRALHIREQALGAQHPDVAVTLTNLAWLYSLTNANAKAEPLLVRATDIRKRALGEKHPAYAFALHGLATLYTDTGQYTKAEALDRRALAILEEAFDAGHPACAVALAHLARVCQATDRPVEAVALLTRGMAVEQTNVRQVFGFSSEAATRAYLATVGHSLPALISLAKDAGRAGEADAVRAAMTWTLRRKALLFDTLHRFAEAQRLLGHDEALARQVGQWRAVRQRLANLALDPPRQDAEAARRASAALRARADRMEADLHRALAQGVRALSPDDAVDPDAVRRRLPRGAALLEFLRLPVLNFRATGDSPRWKAAHYFACVLTARASSRPRLIDLGEADAIDRGVEEFRQQMAEYQKDLRQAPDERQSRRTEREQEQSLAETSQALYRLVLRPLLPVVGEAAVLYVAPDGELNRLPFEALVDDEGKYLAEKWSFAYLSNGRDLLRPAPAPGAGTAVFAAPDYDLRLEGHALQAREDRRPVPVRGGPDVRGLRWTRLAGAEAEAGDVKEALAGSRYGPVRLYVGRDAREETLKALRSPRVLHVATHGFFLPDQPTAPEERDAPMEGGAAFGAARGLARLRGLTNPLLRSGIVLAGANRVGDGRAQAEDDGWVTAEEIALMDLRGTELVVLSACESGAGDVRAGEGVYGLRRAFLCAGARTLVISFFKVPDAETRELMRRFYAGLRAGRGKLEALHQAQLRLLWERRKQRGGAHPFYWASFVLVGSPD
jgi:CHAT domain-containing protein